MFRIFKRKGERETNSEKVDKASESVIEEQPANSVNDQYLIDQPITSRDEDSFNRAPLENGVIKNNLGTLRFITGRNDGLNQQIQSSDIGVEGRILQGKWYNHLICN